MPERLKTIVLVPQHTYRQLFTPALLERLRGLCEVVAPLPSSSLTDAAVAPHLDSLQVIITGWGTPSLATADLARMPNLQLIAHAAGSVKDTVDPDLLETGVRITSAANINARPVAEFTLAYILLENKAVHDWIALYKDLRRSFRKAAYPGFATVGNAGKTVGIVGASRVGRCLINLLAPYDLDLLVYDPMLSEADTHALGATHCTLDDLLRSSDIVSLNAPALPSTRHLIGRHELSLIGDGRLLINTARGAIVDQDAMIAELATGRIRAVLDVTEPEPLPDDCPLYDLPNVVLTPHIAGSVGVEVYRLTDHALGEIESFVTSGILRDEVKREHWDFAA